MARQADELASIPASQLAAMKLVVNQAYENMGLSSTQTLGPILDGLMRNTPDAQAFIETASAKGAGAAARGHTVAELASAWLMAQPFVSTVIAGARTIAQLEENIGSHRWRLTSEDLAAIDAICPPPARQGRYAERHQSLERQRPGKP